MRRKSMLLAIAVLAILLGSSGAVLGVLLRHVPSFYARGDMPDGPERKKLADDFETETTRIIGELLNADKKFEGEFQDGQINSYFLSEDFAKHGLDNLLPERVSRPRIALEPEHLRLGFRYGTGLLSTVISVNMRVWIVPKEANMVALEIENMHAGALPISAQSLLEDIRDRARKNNMEADWYRYNRHPVLVLRFEADKTTPRFQLHRLDLGAGVIRVSGRTLEGALTQMMPSDKLLE